MILVTVGIYDHVNALAFQIAFAGLIRARIDETSQLVFNQQTVTKRILELGRLHEFYLFSDRLHIYLETA